jgi:hypothetical protein
MPMAVGGEIRVAAGLPVVSLDLVLGRAVENDAENLGNSERRADYAKCCKTDECDEHRGHGVGWRHTDASPRYTTAQSP